MNIKKLTILAGLIIISLVLNGCANSNFNKKYNKPFKHNTPLIKGKNVVADGKSEISKTKKYTKWIIANAKIILGSLKISLK